MGLKMYLSRLKIAILFLSTLLILSIAGSDLLAEIPDEKFDISGKPVIITTSSRDYFLQVGIFSVEKNVENLQDALSQSDIPVTVEAFENRGGRTLKKVLVGPFLSSFDAEGEIERVRELTGLDPIVIMRERGLDAPERAGPIVSKLAGDFRDEPPPVSEITQGTRAKQRTAPEKSPTVENIESAQQETGAMAEDRPMEEPVADIPPTLEEKEKQVAGARKPRTVEKPEPKTTGVTAPEPSEKPESVPGKEEKPQKQEKPKIEAPPRKRAGVEKQTDPKVSLDFTDVDISVLVKFISEVTGKNFIYDEKVRGNITIISPKKISRKEMYQVFLSVLQVKGFTTIEQGNVVKIIPARDAKQEGLKTYKKRDYRVTDEFITQLIPLSYIDAKDATPLLTPLISKEGLITFYGPSNTLIIIDRGSNISRIAEILAELDVGTAAQIFRLFQLRYASSDEVSNILGEIFQTGDAQVRPQPTSRRRPQQATAAQPPGNVGKAKFISDSRTNSIIVLAPSELVNEIEEMISKLDIPAPENVGKINVFYLENADAEELATVLNTLISGAGVAGKTAQPGQPSTIKGIITPEFEGPIKISADKSTNSLLIIASPGDYLTLVDVIKKLDIKRRQVYVEAIIMEVTLDKGLDFGVEYRGAFEPTDSSAAIVGSNFNFSGNVNDLLLALAAGNPLLLAGEGLTAGVIGGTVILPDGTEIPAITAILRAAQVSSNTNVLATPHLLTTDNQEAEIIVGENVPFITSQARDTTNLGNIINTVEREDVGTTLRIIPQIHESDFVKLDIYQETSAIKEGTTILETNTVGPTTTKRSAKTNIIVKSGQTIILGGLMQERNTRSVSKIPILGDIPILGALFRFESNNSQKTNLLIFLTPRIIKDTGELQGVTLKMKESMKDFIERNVEKPDDINAEEYNKVLDPFTIKTDGP